MAYRFQFGADARATPTNPARRNFLVNASGVASALVIGVVLPDAAIAQERGVVEQPPRPGAFVRIAGDNTVTVMIKHLDMGQGTATGLTTVVAEELDADWSQMRYEFAAADTAKYRNTLLGVQGTGASTSMANSWSELRKAGAAARAMLITAAAAEWAVAEDGITCEKGVLRHAASGRQVKFGDIAARAAQLPVPANVVLKDPKAFALIGTERARRLDSSAKTDGSQEFGLDVRLPGMLFAAIARPSHFGAKLESVDDAPARAVPGVVNVVRTAYGVAVIADDTWSAFRGRDALKPVWNLRDAETRSSDAMVKDFRALAQAQGVVSKDMGDVEEALRGAATAVEAEYHFPYLAHAPMEPLNAVIEPTADGVNVHAGCQFHTVDQGSIAQELGLRPDQVQIVTRMAGGTFGRRANPAADYMKEAAAIFKASGGKAPLQLVWSRADDLHGGYYRSMFLHKVKAGVDAKGELVAWKHRVVGHSIGEGTAFARFLVKNGIDQTSQEGSYENKYAVKNFQCDVHAAPKKVPVLWWRSVGHSHSAFVVETMVDEMAVAAKKDPVAFRLARLGGNPRLANVLKLAAEKAQWGKALPAGIGRGVAAHESFGAFVAHVAQVRVTGGRLRVERIVCAVDCGTAVNPDVIRAQVEGGVAFALSAVLHQAITFKEGVVEQDNFHSYPLLRMHEMPKVEVHIVPSSAPPTGIGEPPVPTVGPAVANAYFAATRKRIRTLPFAKAGVSV